MATANRPCMPLPDDAATPVGRCHGMQRRPTAHLRVVSSAVGHPNKSFPRTHTSSSPNRPPSKRPALFMPIHPAILRTSAAAATPPHLVTTTTHAERSRPQPPPPPRAAVVAMAVSNNITACVTLLALICAVPVIASGIWFASAQGEECARLARWPVAILGGLLLLAALAGFVGAYWNRRRLLAFYLFAMASLVVLLIALLVFAFAVTRGSGAYPVLGRAYDDYHLDGFSMWLRGYVSDDPGRWEKIRACLAVSDTCKKLARQAAFTNAEQFYQSHLSPLQSGCCKPPSVCGFSYVSPTVWTAAARPAADPDCGLWSNDPGQLCYECESCKAGLLETLRDQWHKANIALVVATVALVILYLVGCSAYKNAQAAAIFSRYKY